MIRTFSCSRFKRKQKIDTPMDFLGAHNLKLNPKEGNVKRRHFVEMAAGMAVLANPTSAKKKESLPRAQETTEAGAQKNGGPARPQSKPMSGRLGPASNIWPNESNKVSDEEVAFQKKFVDPETGILVIRLTSEPCVSHHIYPEAPISTPDGKRFIFARRQALGGKTTFWIADLETLRVRQITDEEGASAPVVTPDGKWFFYSVGRRVNRMSPETFEREVVFEIPDELEGVGGIVSVDYSGTRFLAGARGKSGFGKVRADCSFENQAGRTLGNV